MVLCLPHFHFFVQREIFLFLMYLQNCSLEWLGVALQLTCYTDCVDKKNYTIDDYVTEKDIKYSIGVRVIRSGFSVE